MAHRRPPQRPRQRLGKRPRALRRFEDTEIEDMMGRGEVRAVHSGLLQRRKAARWTALHLSMAFNPAIGR